MIMRLFKWLLYYNSSMGEDADRSKSCISMTVLPSSDPSDLGLCINTTALVLLNCIFQTIFDGWVKFLKSLPRLMSQSLTLPSFAALRIRSSSNCKQVIELSCAENCCVHSNVSISHTRKQPSAPPLTRVFPESCSCPTSEVCPCNVDKHSPV